MTLPGKNDSRGSEAPLLVDSTPSFIETVTFDSQIESQEAKESSANCGRYLLERLLGSGGFGEVWKGVDPSLNRPVAVKRLRTDRVVHSQGVSAFLEEGRKLALLKHPGIVTVYDAGMSDGDPYIVSELIWGGSLATRLKREVLPVLESCRIVRELAETLHYLHGRGIVHRDIKPQNILLENGKPKLADFGLAISEFEQLSEKPGVVGTYAYMSPEQVRGDSHLVDGRSDLYSLGVVFYQMLAGRVPFLGNSREQLRDQILQREPRPLRSINNQIPPALEAVCQKCLRKSISERYTTAFDLVQDLKAYEHSVKSTKPRRRVGIISSLLVIALLAGVAVGWMNRSGVGDPELPNEEVKEVQPPQPAEISPVKNLLGSVATRPITEYVVGPDGRHLSVTAFDRSLVSLGTANEDELEWKVSFQQPNWSGNLGIFFGFRPTGDGHTQYHALYLFNVGRQRYLRSSVYHFRTDNPAGVHTDHLISQWKIDNFQFERNTIGIVIRDGKLVHLEFNDQDLDETLLSKMQEKFYEGEKDCTGQFGLFNLEATGRFWAPEINEQVLPFAGDD